MKYLKLYKYIAQSYNEVSNNKLEIIGNHISNITNNHDKIGEYFKELKIKEPIKFDEVIEGFSDTEYDDKVIAFISACGLAFSDKINVKEYNRLIEIAKALKLDNSVLNLIGLIFDYQKFRRRINKKSNNQAVLEIGNSLTKSDIYVKSLNVKAKIFQNDDKIYYLGFSANGKIILNENKILNDWIPIEINDTDIISIGNLNLTKNEIERRILRKNKKFQIELWLMNENKSQSLKLKTANKNNKPGFSIKIEKNACKILNTDSNLEVIIQKKNLKNNVSQFISIDEEIIIFHQTKSVNERIPNIINIPDILKQYEEDTRTVLDVTSEFIKYRISNKDKKAKIFLDSLYRSNKEVECEIILSKGTGLLNIYHSDFKIYINNIPVKDKSKALNQNDIIQIDKKIILCDIVKGVITTEKIKIDSINVKNLEFKYNKNKDSALSNINFENKSGDFTCIMGPSGCGKSTLLKIMLGNINGHTGSVNFNGVDFHENFKKLRKMVGYVPQEDLLFENLSVYENLYYTGKLKCPELPEKILKKRIEETLVELGLSDKRNLKVGSATKRNLSGGERRRLNIGLEILANVDVLYLDEPTSGLSSWDSKKVIDLLRTYTSKGKIVYVVIHQPSSDIYYKFNKIILLDYGGKLAFFGNTKEAVSYFYAKKYNKNITANEENISPDLILEVLQEEARDLNGQPVYETGKDKIKRLVRKKTPQKWALEFEYYKAHNRLAIKEKSSLILPKIPRSTIIHRFIRIIILFMRNLKDKLNDRSYLITTFAISPVLSFLLSVLMKGGGKDYSFYLNKNFDKFIFLTTIIFIFFGITNSIGEIIKDRVRIQSERLIDIKTIDYIFTKIFTVVLFTVIQIVLYMAICIPVLEIPFSLFKYNFYGFEFLLFFFLMLFLIAFSSMMVGFLVSTVIKSEKSIYTIIPLLIVPQIIFGGLFMSYDDMGGRFFQNDRPIPVYNDLMLSRWGYEGLMLTAYHFNPLNDHVWNNSLSKVLRSQKLNDYNIKNELYNTKEISFNKNCETKIFNSVIENKDSDNESKLKVNKWKYFEYKNKRYAKYNLNTFLEMILFNHNVFFYKNKLIFNIKNKNFIEVPTVYYNLFMLLIYSVILFIIIVSITHKIRYIKNKTKEKK